MCFVHVCVLTSTAGEAVGAVCTAVTPESHHVGQTHTLTAHLVTAGVAGALCRTLAGCNKRIINSSYWSVSSNYWYWFHCIRNFSILTEEKPGGSLRGLTCAAWVTIVTRSTLVTWRPAVIGPAVAVTWRRAAGVQWGARITGAHWENRKWGKKDKSIYGSSILAWI